MTSLRIGNVDLPWVIIVGHPSPRRTKHGNRPVRLVRPRSISYTPPETVGQHICERAELLAET